MVTLTKGIANNNKAMDIIKLNVLKFTLFIIIPAKPISAAIIPPGTPNGHLSFVFP